MRYLELLQQLKPLWGLDPAEYKNERGFLLICPNTGVEVSLEMGQTDDDLSFYAYVGELPEGNEEIWLKYLMQSHLLGRQTGLSTFGYDEDTRGIYLFKVLQKGEYTAEAISTMVQDIVSAVNFWKEQLNSGAWLSDNQKESSLEAADFNSYAFYQRV